MISDIEDHHLSKFSLCQLKYNYKSKPLTSHGHFWMVPFNNLPQKYFLHLTPILP